MTTAEVFDDIYRRNVWGGSGGGSRSEVAWPFVAFAKSIIRKPGVTTVLDIGCGDGWVGRWVYSAEWLAVYIGIDASTEAISKIQNTPAMSYIVADALNDELPRADLVLLKEVTQHLSNADVRKLLDRLKQYPAVLHCSALAAGPEDIETGGYRPVRLKDFGIETQPILEWTAEGSSYQMELWRPKACTNS